MFACRGLLVHPHELDETWIDQCQSLGLNMLGLHPVGGRHADQSLQAMLDMHADGSFLALLDRARRAGLLVNHEMHALSWLVPRTLAGEHPDWFRMDEAGCRTADFNLCPSCSEAMDFLAGRAEQLARLLPSDTHTYCFWPDDVSKARCHCLACRALTASDQQLMLMHAVLRGARRADPQAMVPFLAYQDTLEPPMHVKPEAGVFLEFAPIHRRADRPIGDAACPENARETAHLQALLALFGTEHAQVLEYWLDNSLYSGWKYPPRPFAAHDSVIAADAAYYAAHGFERVTTFACYLGEDYRRLHGMPDIAGYGRALAASACR